MTTVPAHARDNVNDNVLAWHWAHTGVWRRRVCIDMVCCLLGLNCRLRRERYSNGHPGHLLGTPKSPHSDVKKDVKNYRLRHRKMLALYLAAHAFTVPTVPLSQSALRTTPVQMMAADMPSRRAAMLSAASLLALPIAAANAAPEDYAGGCALASP